MSARRFDATLPTFRDRLLGLIAGFLAKLIMPGDDPGSVIVTIIIGVAGGVIGGFVGNVLGFGAVSGLNVVSIILAVVGAIILLIGYRLIVKKKTI